MPSNRLILCRPLPLLLLVFLSTRVFSNGSVLHKVLELQLQYQSFQWIFSVAAAASKSLQSCLTLCEPIDGSPPGSPVPGIVQARTLEWVAISFSNAWKWKVKVKSLSHVWLLVTPWTSAYQAPLPMGFSRQEYWSGLPLLSPIQGWFPLKMKVKVAQSCPTLCDPMDYTVQARILEWVAVPFPRGSSQPRDWTQVFLISGGFFTTWATRDAQEYWSG